MVPRMANEPETPPRRGWTWTILKCALLITVSAALFAGALYWMVHLVTPPWFVPKFIFEWVVTHLTPYALAAGGVFGAFLGFLGAPFVVFNDARRGRLTRV